MGLLDPSGTGPPDAPDRRKVVTIIVGSLAVTGGLVALALSLGSWAYRHRRSSLHEGRLRRLLGAHPTSQQVAEGLVAEGAVPVETPASEADLRRLVSTWSSSRADDVVARRRRWPELRIFALADVAYFLYFDDKGVLQDYLLLTR